VMPSRSTMLVIANSEGKNFYDSFLNVVWMFSIFFLETDVMPSETNMLIVATSEGKNCYDVFFNVMY
jgi:hypothetical protein